MNYSEMEQEITNLKEERVTLKAEIGEMRRLQDRLFTIVISSWGIIVAIVVTLIGVNALNNIRVYNRDIQAVHDELKKNVDEARSSLDKHNTTDMGRLAKELKDEVLVDHKQRLEEIRREVSKNQVEGFAYTLGQVADIRLFLHDVEGAVRAGLEQFDNATRSNTNYQAHALDKLTSAFHIGIQDQKRIPEELLSQVQSLLERSDVISDPRLIKLQQTIQSYRAMLRN